MRRPHLAFWQKTYLLTLALFLVCLNGGVFVVAALGRASSYNAECEKYLAQQHYIAQSRQSDAQTVYARRPQAAARLAESYARSYGPAVGLRVVLDGEILADTLPAPGQGDVPAAPAEGSRAHAVAVADGRHVLYVAAALPLEGHALTLVCGFDMEPFFAQWDGMLRTYEWMAFAVSAVLAVGLYFVLHGLSRPLTRLAGTAQKLAAGDYSARSAGHGADEVGQLAAALDDMAEKTQRNMRQLEENAAQKQQLVDDLAHELRTPLTAIAGYAEYMQRAQLSEEEHYEATNYMMEEARRLAHMSEQLVQMAALEGEQMRRRPVDVPALLLKVRRTIAPKAAAAGVKLSFPTPPPCAVQGEEALLESMLVNLADNAVKACRPGGLVTVAATAGPGGVTLAVADTGCGMDAETLRHLGQEFYRPDKARSRASGGAGLGLALCMRIARAHGAKLEFSSKEGQGTAVRIHFTSF